MAGSIRLTKSYQFIDPVNKKMWVTRPVTYSKIDSDALLDYAELNSGINRGQLSAAMHALLQTFENFLCNGHSVQLPEVGTFRFSVRAHARDDEADAGCDAVKYRKVVYTPSTKMKDLLNSIALTCDNDVDSDEEEAESDTESESE